MRPRGLVPPVLMTSILGSTFICIKLDCECHANATGVLRVLLAAGVLLIRWLRGLRMPPEPVVSCTAQWRQPWGTWCSPAISASCRPDGDGQTWWHTTSSPARRQTLHSQVDVVSPVRPQP